MLLAELNESVISPSVIKESHELEQNNNLIFEDLILVNEDQVKNVSILDIKTQPELAIFKNKHNLTIKIETSPARIKNLFAKGKDETLLDKDEISFGKDETLLDKDEISFDKDETLEPITEARILSSFRTKHILLCYAIDIDPEDYLIWLNAKLKAKTRIQLDKYIFSQPIQKKNPHKDMTFVYLGFDSIMRLSLSFFVYNDFLPAMVGPVRSLAKGIELIAHNNSIVLSNVSSQLEKSEKKESLYPSPDELNYLLKQLIQILNVNHGNIYETIQFAQRQLSQIAFLEKGPYLKIYLEFYKNLFYS